MEKNRRTWKIWFMDASKQAVGSGMLHVLNLGAAIIIGSNSSNPCIWYFINFTIDTLLGMVFCFLLLKLLEKCLQNRGNASFKSGYYGEPA
mmetsp:Transcript_14417/g.2362  ORF Transcript_14417/g.2362 Transcript_14417/m.2362 type:complete len:91 (+) Transcript_14417:138-410(+)